MTHAANRKQAKLRTGKIVQGRIVAWYSKQNRTRTYFKVGAIGFAIFALLVLTPYLWGEWHYDRIEREASAAREQSRQQAKAARDARRIINVTERYDLSWPARDGAPALKMSIPVADMGAWRRYENPRIPDTLQGPDTVVLVMPLPGQMQLAQLEMHRDAVKPEDSAERMPAACSTSLMHQGRHVRIDLERPNACRGGTPKEAKSAAVDEASRFLERLGFETLVPPSVDMRLERLRRTYAKCDAPPKVSVVLCNYTIALGHALLKEAPKEASQIMLNAMAATGPQRNERWDHFYREDVEKALAEAPR